MSFVISSNDYVDYLIDAAAKIAANEEYITKLDSATGDGDHWLNIHSGFQCFVSEADTLRTLPLNELFKKAGTIMMNKVGGSSGILYGGAYLAAARRIADMREVEFSDLCGILESMVEDMCIRGKAEAGYKTMIDTLFPAVVAFKQGLAENLDYIIILDSVKQAAIDGAESTREMEAVKGRASYQQNKGVGHLDPGAVTMSYQIICLCDRFKRCLLDLRG
jgi:dihydroxyacetone kinase, phosphoprotein-dependent, L subunit